MAKTKLPKNTRMELESVSKNVDFFGAILSKANPHEIVVWKNILPKAINTD